MAGPDVIVMPKLGLTMTEGLLTEWKVKAGEPFKAGNTIFLVETDKVTNEIAAEADGTIGEVLAEEGSTVPVGEPVARLKGAGAAPALPETAAEPTVADTPRVEAPAPSPQPIVPNATGPAGGRVYATPLARRMAREHGLDIATVTGTGPRNRIKAADVTRALDNRQVEDMPAPLAVSQGTPAGPIRTPSRNEAVIARRLTQSVTTIPHFHLFSTASIGELAKLRAELNDSGLIETRLTLTTFLIAAVGRAIADLPDQSLLWREDGVVSVAGSDVGVAVDTPKGLYAPRIRSAGTASVSKIGSDLAQLADLARSSSLGSEAFEGGVITVSNLGAQNIQFNAPIIDPSQSYILGAGRTEKVFRPDVDEKPVLKHELGLVLAADHRIANGVAAARLLETIIAYLEAPLNLLAGAVKAQNQATPIA
jgi:pyruvate dehydrogenase E2 component (dihydrolipoamide acetyltransferase)